MLSYNLRSRVLGAVWSVVVILSLLWTVICAPPTNYLFDSSLGGITEFLFQRQIYLAQLPCMTGFWVDNVNIILCVSGPSLERVFSYVRIFDVCLICRYLIEAIRVRLVYFITHPVEFRKRPDSGSPRLDAACAHDGGYT